MFLKKPTQRVVVSLTEMGDAQVDLKKSRQLVATFGRPGGAGANSLICCLDMKQEFLWGGKVCICFFILAYAQACISLHVHNPFRFQLYTASPVSSPFAR